MGSGLNPKTNTTITLNPNLNYLNPQPGVVSADITNGMSDVLVVKGQAQIAAAKGAGQVLNPELNPKR